MHHNTNIDISRDDLSDGKVIALLASHLEDMHKYSPPSSIHALDKNRLSDSSITFWSARIGGELAGCGALKALAPDAGEIKSMKTHNDYLRKGVASRILAVILAEASRRKYRSVSLETGSNKAFKPAIALYVNYGFVECPPFGEYQPDPYSKFYTKLLVGDEQDY